MKNVRHVLKISSETATAKTPSSIFSAATLCAALLVFSSGWLYAAPTQQDTETPQTGPGSKVPQTASDAKKSSDALQAMKPYEAPQSLSLHDAVNLARSKNPALRETGERIVQFSETIPVIRSALLPNLSLISNAGYDKDAVNSNIAKFGGDPYNNYQTDLHLTQPLFQVGIVAAVASAEKDREMRRLETEAARRDLTSSVIQSYFQVTQLTRNVDTLVRQQNIVRESVAVTEHRLHIGRSQLLDVLQVKTQVALLDSQISDAKNSLQVAVATLANQLGEVENKEITVHSGLNVPELVDVDYNVDLKNPRLPEIIEDRVAIAQVEDQKQISLGRNLPSLSATADYIYNAPKKADLFDESSESWQLGVQLTIPIFSGLSTIYQQRALASQETQLEYDSRSKELQFSLQQVTSRKKLETAEASIRSGEEALRLAIASSNEATRQYRISTIDFVQFLTVEQTYVQAEQALNLSKYNYIVAITNYFVASGQDLDRLVELLERVNL